MTAKTYKIVAPYVVLRVVQPTGGHVDTGFYKGAVVDLELEEVSLKHHLDEGLILDESAKEAKLFAPDSTPDGSGEGLDLPTAQSTGTVTSKTQSKK